MWVVAAAALSLFTSVLAPANAASAGTYSTPNWFPLRGAHLIGCTYQGQGCGYAGQPYHSWWAMDIKAAKGENIYAAGAGKVTTDVVSDQGGNCNDNTIAINKCPNGSRGNHVLIDHGNGVYSYYAHLTTVGVKPGDWVDQNTVIGTVGDSGWSDPGFYHLHFERRQAATLSAAQNNASAVDPGPLKGCVGTTLKTYPQDLTPAGAGTSWRGLRTEKYTATSDGTGCTRAPTSGPGGPGKPKVDLVFAIDTTGSMGPYIDAVTASARTITNQLFATADARVALVDYKDLYSGCPGDGYAAQVDLPFSTDPAAFGAAVGALTATGGCDTPESVYSGIMQAVRLPWRNGVTKAVLVMGDAPPHDPEPTTGYTRASVAAAAIAVDPAAIYSINIGGGGSPYFDGLASDTGGQAYPTADPTGAVDSILTAITAITASTVAADAGGPYSGAVGDPVTFDASNSTGGTTPIARYEWDFNNDGTYDQTTTLPTVTHKFTAPYTGKIGLRVTTATPEQTATATADVTILPPMQIRYTGQRAGRSGHTAHVEAFITCLGEHGRCAGDRDRHGDSDGHGLRGATVVFILGAATCTARSGADGEAACELTVPPPGTKNVVTASANLAGYFPAATGADFHIQH